MAISEKRREAARRNGAKSRGPVTAEGKRRSSLNALRHGILAEAIVLEGECPESFQALQDAFYVQFQPQNPVEQGFVDEMVSANWRLRRLWTVEKTLLESKFDRVLDDLRGDRIASAFAALAGEEGANVDLLSRYETRLHRIFARAHDNLRKLRGERTPPPVDCPEPPAMQSSLPNEPGDPAGPLVPDPSAKPAAPTRQESGHDEVPTGRPGSSPSPRPVAKKRSEEILHFAG